MRKNAEFSKLKKLKAQHHIFTYVITNCALSVSLEASLLETTRIARVLSGNVL